MVSERRVFNRLPEYLQTDQNSRDMYITDDVMFEPEKASFLTGFIGDVSALTDEDLERTPQIAEDSAERQRAQLSIGAAYIDPDTTIPSRTSFYEDLVRQIRTNGGLVDDPNRVFATPFYAWSPPVDYDKHINFSRYFWTGPGAADVNGEYLTKEAQGSQTVIYELVGTNLVKRDVVLSNGFPGSPTTGELIEDCSTSDRIIYQWDGSSWNTIGFITVPNTDIDLTDYLEGTMFYVTRSGPNFQRPLMWRYSEKAGRWLSQAVVVSLTEPDAPREGMIWEDVRIPPYRRFFVYRNSSWVLLTWTNGIPSGTPTDATYRYDNRSISAITDGWSANNWWRHYEDLAAADREALSQSDQALRPILEFWAGLEAAPGDARTDKNDPPVFQLYAYRYASNDIQAITDTYFPGASTQGQATIYEYRRGTGRDDLVLGFPLSYDTNGEFQFELTLESQAINLTGGALRGYRFFKDSFTGLIHSVWAKSDELTHQEQNQDGVYEAPVSVTSNPDHEVLTTTSRAKVLRHFSSVIEAQIGNSGNKLGLNGYRWSAKNPTLGATLIDSEMTLLRAMASLQMSVVDIPDTIRQTARDYNKVLFRFLNKLNELFDNTILADPAGTLLVTPTEAVNAIFTELFVGRNETFPYYYSDMGTFLETQVFNGVATVLDNEPRPIFIPPSAPRIGAAPAYVPESFLDRDGTVRLRGHDGTVIDSFGDDRDLVWMNLQERFLAVIPDYFRTENTTFSSRFTRSNFFLEDYYGNYSPTTQVNPVAQVVENYQSVVSPTVGLLVFSQAQGAYAYYDGAKWLTKPAIVDDIFLNQDNNSFYIFNGLRGVMIRSWNRSFTWDYSVDEYRNVIRREFERWASSMGINFIDNVDFDQDDPFTWNYRSAGIEGHYLGVYRRVYNTVRPHSHPWEILGYTVEPEWWRTEYVPTTTFTDGTPRYANTHPMWADLQAGIINPITGETRAQMVMVGPIPVDLAGELLDPIEAGVVDLDALDQGRINDAWVFGDGAPKEQEFYNSPFYQFAQALAGYLMKNGIWVDLLWSLLYIDIGDTGVNRLWRATHVIHRDTLTRPNLAALPVHLNVADDGTTVQQLGLQAWISERVRILGGDVTNDFSKIVQNTTPSLIWKTAGFINRNRNVITTLSGKRIPYEDATTLINQSYPVETKFISGVLVTREDTGYRVYGYDLFNPYFRVELPAIPITGGQVELREEFVAAADQHEFKVTQFNLPLAVDTASMGVLVNGLRLKPQHVTIIAKNTFKIEDAVTINGGEIITLVFLTIQSNTSTRTKRFTVKGVDFPYFATGSGTYQDIEYGRFFESSTDVINFMVGYGRYLERQGWVFDYTDPETGDSYDWISGAKRFATWVLDRESPWNPNASSATDEFTFSPVNQLAKLNTTFGQVLNMETIQYGSYGVLDVQALPIDPEEITSTRIMDELVVKSTTPMYGIRVHLVEYQHVVVFSNITKFNDIIYDPVLALYHKALRVDTYRTTEWTGKPDAAGFVISEGDLLPNFEKQAKDITRFYDRINTIDDPLRRDQARNLYGWAPNNHYMDAIGADERSRFDYFRGMIHTKGTKRPMIAFAKGTRLGIDNVSINEDWAWKLTEYGDRRRELVQFRITHEDFRDEVQIIHFGGPEILSDHIIDVLDFDRSQIDQETRWILPPSVGQEQVTNLRFPITTAGLPDTARANFYSILFDTSTDLTVLRHFHYDPQLGKFDPEVMAQIDYFGFYDPARYTDGPGEVYSNELAWGPEQVGKVWWSWKYKKFTDYRSLLPDYDMASREWGKLLYFKATITRTNDVVTVQVLDPYTGLPVNHELQVDDKVIISGAQQDEYNGEITITAVTSTTFEYLTTETPDSPATGDIRVQIGRIDVMEWVKSPVAPQEWESYIESLRTPGSPTGIVDDPINTSYVIQDEIVDGRTTRYYYFWTRSNTGDNPVKTISSQEMENRLRSPTATNQPWFAPVDQTYMLMFTDGEKVHDNYGIELIVDQRELDTHIEWALITEGDEFRPIPEGVVMKMIDSMSGIDEIGTTVPYELLSDTEKYGNEFFPPQTVFRDRTEAIRVYVSAVNRLLKTKRLNSVETITGIFDLVDEGTYWVRTDQRDEDYLGKTVLETVATTAIRDSRAANEYYIEGDLVTVKASGNHDPWTGAEVSTTYVYTGGTFLDVGVNNFTVEINTTLADSIAKFREIFTAIYSMLDTVEQNSLMFSLLYEMLHQNGTCDWFFKTSYLSVHVSDNISNSPFVRLSEIDAVLDNILDVKPFHVKLRSNTLKYSLPEAVPVGITEFPDKMIAMIIDRLACSAAEDGGWDGYAWDDDPKGWDTPIWEYADLGRDEWYSLGTQTGDSIKFSFVFIPKYDPFLYEHRVILRFNGEEIDLSDQGVSYTINKSRSAITVTYNFQLSSQYTVELQQNWGFYQGQTPTLGGTLEDTLFSIIPSSYKHQVARLMENKQYAEIATLLGCDIGQSPEERIELGVQSNVNILVTTEYTKAYDGWDATPWDTTGWDQGPPNVGSRMFIVSVGGSETIPPGLRVLDTSENYVAGTTQYVIGNPTDGEIVQVRLNNVAMVEGTHYQFVEPFSHVVEFIEIGDLIFTGDGITTVFDTSEAINGFTDVYVDGVLQTDVVDYTINGSAIEFIQPSPTVIPINATTRGRSYVGTGGTESYVTGHDSASLNVLNAFVFHQGLLVETTDYTVSSEGFDITGFVPAFGDEILLFALGNDIESPTARFTSSVFTGDGATSLFVIGMGAGVRRTFVFLDGVYQVYGVDYTIPVSGSVQFVVPPGVGQRVELRNLNSATYLASDLEHLVFNASGAATDVIPGLSDVDPDRIMVFLDDAIQDGYSTTAPDYYITNGVNDTITWITPSAPGTKISLRMIRSVTIDQTLNVITVPPMGSEVRVVSNPFLTPGDIITFIYNGWTVGPLGKFTVVSAPVDWTIENGVLRLVQAIPNPGGTITLNYTQNRLGEAPRGILVRMQRIVEEVLADHTVYDSGIDTARKIGITLVNTTSNRYFTWDGTDWIDDGAVSPADVFYVMRTQTIVEYDGSAYNTVFELGDSYTMPPVLSFPAFGRGITYGTYAYGQSSNASVDFPEAYQIMQHPGDY